MATAPKKASALTAALSGAPATGGAPPKPPGGPSKPLDNYAFPCLLDAPDDGTEIDGELAEGVDALALRHSTVVGSAPTNTLLPNGTPLVRGTAGARREDCAQLPPRAGPRLPGRGSVVIPLAACRHMAGAVAGAAWH